MSLSLRRVLVKVSGEALMGRGAFGLEAATVEKVATDIAAAASAGFEIAVVVGGGNFVRGVSIAGEVLDRATADHMGMLATVINALALERAIEAKGLLARTLSAVPMPTVCESYSRQKALDHLASGRIVIAAGGTGNPFFTTDTAAVLRAAEMRCDAVLKATQVDGVYSADPKKDPTAKRFERISHEDAIRHDLKVMDTAAFALAREQNLPIIVFALGGEAGIKDILQGRGRFTTVA